MIEYPRSPWRNGKARNHRSPQPRHLRQIQNAEEARSTQDQGTREMSANVQRWMLPLNVIMSWLRSEQSKSMHLRMRWQRVHDCRVGNHATLQPQMSERCSGERPLKGCRLWALGKLAHQNTLRPSAGPKLYITGSRRTIVYLGSGSNQQIQPSQQPCRMRLIVFHSSSLRLKGKQCHSLMAPSRPSHRHPPAHYRSATLQNH